MEDLLFAFETPSCMDCKVGTRTYLETELNKAREDPEPRPDMFDKMSEVCLARSTARSTVHTRHRHMHMSTAQVDPAEPTATERAVRAVTKVRYMQWRETTSSTAALGFRIDGIRVRDDASRRTPTRSERTQQLCTATRLATPNCHATQKSGGGSVNTKDLKTMKNWADLKDCFAHFTSSDARVIVCACRRVPRTLTHTPRPVHLTHSSPSRFDFTYTHTVQV